MKGGRPFICLSVMLACLVLARLTTNSELAVLFGVHETQGQLRDRFCRWFRAKLPIMRLFRAITRRAKAD